MDKAARLEKIAAPGQILVEAGVIDPIGIRLEQMPFIKIPDSADISELRLKGLNDPVHFFDCPRRKDSKKSSGHLSRR